MFLFFFVNFRFVPPRSWYEKKKQKYPYLLWIFVSLPWCICTNRQARCDFFIRAPTSTLNMLEMIESCFDFICGLINQINLFSFRHFTPFPSFVEFEIIKLKITVTSSYYVSSIIAMNNFFWNIVASFPSLLTIYQFSITTYFIPCSYVHLANGEYVIEWKSFL